MLTTAAKSLIIKKEEKKLIGIVYSGYLAAINITALIAWIAEFDFSRETVKTEDEIGAAVLCALGGAASVIALTMIARKSVLPWYCLVVYVASLVLHITALSVVFTVFPAGGEVMRGLCSLV